MKNIFTAIKQSPFTFESKEALVAICPRVVFLFPLKEQKHILGNLYYHGLLTYEECISMQPATKEHIDFIDEFY